MTELLSNLASILDEIPLGVCLISKDRKVVFMNGAMEVLTGFSRKDSEGISCSHILRFNKCSEECPAKKSGDWGKCTLEGDIIGQDHKKIPVRVSFSRLRDDSGEPAGYIEVYEDLRQARYFDPAKNHPFSFGRMIGRSPQMERIFQFLPVVAQSDAPVLITGQTGTGKDLLAEAIHHASSRAKDSFVTFRCGALPETLAEAELFGVEKGAIPGAESKPGKFRLALNGTLLLAEVCDLSPSLQAKLVNYLDEKIIYPVGGPRSISVDVRIIAASSKNLDQMAREGSFRKELYFRLNAVSLHLPPLKDRGDDLRLLMDHFLHARSSLLSKPIKRFSDECLKKLESYTYPGNILELRHIVEYAVDLCRSDTIQIEDLPAYLTESFDDLAPNPPMSTSGAVAGDNQENELDWAEVERKLIIDSLVRANGRRAKAAQLLGWGRSTLWRKMKQYGMLSVSDGSE
ncbi:MAG: sigma 54-interacting transcriptional regulator [Syntrophobacteraceae bacterium]